MKKFVLVALLLTGCGSYEIIDRKVKVKIIDVFSGDYNTVVVSYERQDGSRHSIGVRVPKAIPSAGETWIERYYREAYTLEYKTVP